MNKSVEDLRRRNLALLKEQWGDEWQALAKKVGESPSYMSQIQTGRRPFTEKTARKWELKLGLSSGWFDEGHDKTSGPASQNDDGGLLERTIAAVDSALKAERKDIDRSKFGRLVTFVYEDSRERGAQSESWLRRLVRLILEE